MPPEHLSLHNALPGRVSAVRLEAGAGQAVVSIEVGSLHLLAEVTRDAVRRMNLATGHPVYALVKSVAVEV